MSEKNENAAVAQGDITLPKTTKMQLFNIAEPQIETKEKGFIGILYSPH